MNELDQFIKHQLKLKYYFRYADDFIIADCDENYLRSFVHPIADFLGERLRLELHPKKVELRKFSQGIDFLGYVVLPHHVVMRTKTKRRMFKKINSSNISSYLGLLKHCDSFKIKQKLLSLDKS